MKIFQMKFAGRALAVGALCAALAGCAGGANYYVQDNSAATNPYPGSPLPRQALADDVYLDGTGVTARRMGGAPDTSVETVRVSPPAGGPSHAVARSRPTAIPRNEEMSSATTGARASVSNEANKPFTAEWMAREKAADDRLRSRMSICQGC